MENQIKQTRKQNWFQKQFSSQNGENNRPKQGTYEAAVAAAAFAIQSVEDARTTTQFSFKKSSYAVENSKDKPMKHKPKELERVHSSAKPTSQYAAIRIAPGDNAEWYDKLKRVVVCGK